MRSAMRRCTACWSYTFKDECTACGGRTSSPMPPRFSPEDRYGKYRRQLKELAASEAAQGGD